MATICDHCGMACGRYHVGVSFTGTRPGEAGKPDEHVNIGHVHFHTQPGSAPDQGDASCFDAAYDLMISGHEEHDPTWDAPANADRMKAKAAEPKRDPLEDEWRKRIERKARIRRLSKADRERLVIEQIGDRGLTVGEVWEVLGEDPGLSEAQIREVMTRLLNAGQLKRKAEPRGRSGTAVRYRYWVRRALDGPIADLERAFRESGQDDS